MDSFPSFEEKHSTLQDNDIIGQEIIDQLVFSVANLCIKLNRLVIQHSCNNFCPVPLSGKPNRISRYKGGLM